MNKNVLFIWVPRTGGTSIWRYLSTQSGSVDKLWRKPYEFENQKIVTFAHTSIMDLLSKNIMSRDYFSNAFKFAFVRNPWERLVSLYFYLRPGNHPKISTKSFDSFCLGLKDIVLEPVGFYNVRGLSQCNQQVDWLFDKDGRLIVDFIGRFENLQSDFEKICDRTGITARRLPRVNITKHRHYSAYYTVETRQVVEELFKKDIETFGYSFEKRSVFYNMKPRILHKCVCPHAAPLSVMSHMRAFLGYRFPHFYDRLRTIKRSIIRCPDES